MVFRLFHRNNKTPSPLEGQLLQTLHTKHAKSLVELEQLEKSIILHSGAPHRLTTRP